MQVKLARQLYELACHCEEGWLTDREKMIVAKIGKPDLEDARRNYQIAMAVQSIRDHGNSIMPSVYRKRWTKHFEAFVNMYVAQETIGMTKETDALLCEWAISHSIPLEAVSGVSHHSREWLNKHVKQNSKLHFGKRDLVVNG